MASLKAMKYRELQRVAKEVGVKANLSTVVLIQKILDAKLAAASEVVSGPGTGDTAAHQRPHVRHGGIQAGLEQPAQVGRHQVPHQDDEDSDTPEGKEADRQLLRMDEEIRKKRARSRSLVPKIREMKRKRAQVDENGNDLPPPLSEDESS